MGIHVRRVPGSAARWLACVPAVALALVPAAPWLDPTPGPSRLTATADAGHGANLRAAVDTVLDEDWSRGYRTVRAIVVAVDGNVRAERYPAVAPSETTPVGSVTGAILATLVGVAIGERRIGGVDQTLRRPGAGGQLVEVVPQLRLVVVVQATPPEGTALTPPPRLGPSWSVEQTVVSFVDTVLAPIVAGRPWTAVQRGRASTMASASDAAAPTPGVSARPGSLAACRP